MKTLLLILGIIILISKRKAIPNIFKSKEVKRKMTEKMFNELPDKAKELHIDLATLKGLLIIFLGLFCLLYIIFYLLSAIFINTFVFTAISILLMFLTVKTLSNFLKGFDNIENIKVESVAFSVFDIIVDFGYIGYVFFNVYKMW